MTDEQINEKPSKKEIDINTKFNDYFQKVEDVLQYKSVQTIIEDIEQYCNKVSKTKSSKSTDKLSLKYKESLTEISEKYLEEYKETYGDIRKDEKWIFMASTYFDVSEGHVTCLMMTQSLPCHDDYDVDRPNDLPTTTQFHRAVREFHNEFGTFSLYTLGFHTREAFFEKYSIMIPYSLIKIKDKDCDLTFKTKLQYNFP
jgi:hypothetical protein